jgi:hypothetical protein
MWPRDREYARVVGLYTYVCMYVCMYVYIPSFTDWVQNEPRRAIFLNNYRWYRVTILQIFLFVHFSPTDTT